MSKRSGLRKTVLFIVEGPSDEAALEGIIQQLYRNERQIKFAFTNGDVTSNPQIDSSHVISAVYEFIKAYMDDQKLRKSDIYQVVQIFDMDGAYISDANILSSGTETYYYTLDNIISCDRKRVEMRNAHKRELMDILLSVNEINSIPYTMYFMSRNLDHALYNVMRLDKNEKVARADQFYEEYSSNPRKFVEFLKQDVSNGVPEDYVESWNYIRQGTRSLGRHTNLHLYFNEHPLLTW